MYKKVLLVTLQTFSTTGGIQKMTRTLGHSLYQLAKTNNWNFKLWSVYDSNRDLNSCYLPRSSFKGFSNNRVYFVLKTISTGAKTNVVILSHINLAFVGIIIKTLNPGCKIWLIAHGIEVWRPLSVVKLLFLNRCDKVVCVSNFTKQQMIARHKTDASKCEVLNNAVDSFMELPKSFDRPRYLLDRYNLTAGNPILFTLTRINSSEQYKGYEQVIKVIGKLKVKFPLIKYILSGKYDQEEEIRIKNLVASCGVEENVILTGFIDEIELPDHFLLSDLFVLPSKKEGFGIVFIEALACGLPVVCGNADGSIDAIYNGKLGVAVDTDDLAQLENAITGYLNTPLTQQKREKLQKECLLHFNEDSYINKLEKLFV